MRWEMLSQPHLPADARPFAWTHPAVGRQGNKGQQLALILGCDCCITGVGEGQNDPSLLSENPLRSPETSTFLLKKNQPP